MEKGDAFALRPNARRFVYEPHAGRAAALEGLIQVIHGEAHVMNARAALCHEFRDGRIRRFALQQLHEGFPGRVALNTRSVGIVHRSVWQAEHVAIERDALVQRADSDSNVRDGSSTARGGLVRRGWL